jgi:hypothetical protein
MELKKCIRCGCFFTTEDNLCPNCKQRDDSDKKYLKSFIEANGAPSSVQELSFQSGLSLYDINRYLKESEFSGIKKSISMSSNQAAHLDDQLSRMNKKENL